MQGTRFSFAASDLKSTLRPAAELPVACGHATQGRHPKFHGHKGNCRVMNTENQREEDLLACHLYENKTHKIPGRGLTPATKQTEAQPGKILCTE